MKHKKLIIVIIVCVIVFFASATAGVVVAANSLEWSELNVSDLMRGELGGLFDSDGISGLFHGRRINKTVDKSFNIDLSGIKTINVAGVSEELKVGIAVSNTVDCSLTGEYYTVYRDIEYIYEKKGDTLFIHPDYPVFGFISVDLVQEVMIPAEFAGNVEIGIVSGGCIVKGNPDMQWSSLAFTGVSGSFDFESANVDDIRFEMVSGSISLDGCSGKVDGESVSGSMDITWNEFTGGSLNSISGGISLKLPAESSCQLTYHSVSGSLNNSGLGFEISGNSGGQSEYVLNGGRNQLDVETVSGSLDIGPTP